MDFSGTQAPLRGSAERTRLRDLPSWETPGLFPPPPGPRLRRTRSAGGSARAPGGVGGGSQRRDPYRNSGKGPGIAALQRSPLVPDPCRRVGPRRPAVSAPGAICASTPEPRCSPQARHLPTPAPGGLSAGGCRLPHRAGPLTSRWCCGRPIPGAAGPRRTAPGWVAAPGPPVPPGLGQGGTGAGRGGGGGPR